LRYGCAKQQDSDPGKDKDKGDKELHQAPTLALERVCDCEDSGELQNAQFSDGDGREAQQKGEDGKREGGLKPEVGRWAGSVSRWVGAGR
jgi:hypothetical protein